MADQACTSMSVKEAALMHIPDLLSRLGTIRDTGLTDTDVELRRRRYGLNEMKIHDEEPLLIKYIGQVSGHVTCLVILGCINVFRSFHQMGQPVTIKQKFFSL